jgi:hypothetical protein
VNESIELIQALANQLSVPAEYLIDIYAKRVWAEWFPTVASLPLVLITVYLIRVSLKKPREPDPYSDKEGLLILCTVALVLFSLWFLVGTYIALLANASPEAYAVDEILRKLQ